MRTRKTWFSLRTFLIQLMHCLSFLNFWGKCSKCSLIYLLVVYINSASTFLKVVACVVLACRLKLFSGTTFKTEKLRFDISQGFSIYMALKILENIDHTSATLLLVRDQYYLTLSHENSYFLGQQSLSQTEPFS